MSRLIVALDTDFESARRLAGDLGDLVEFYKVGYRLFLSNGRDILDFLNGIGKKVFLDLKFFDIPNTMANAAVQCSELGVFMFNMHIAAGRDAAKRMLEVMPEKRPLLIGVTVLTSRQAQKNEVLDLAKDAKAWGLDGVVCSVGEVEEIKKIGSDFICVCPGIRLIRESSDDQKRVFLPEDAKAAGADYIVVGRPILNADNPKEVVQDILSRLS